MRNGFTLCIVFLLTATSARAQLRGTVIDEKGVAVKFANILLSTTGKSTPAARGVADSAGNFSLPLPAAGNYTLRISAVGFSNHLNDSVRIAADETEKVIGLIMLKTDRKALEEVTVTALRPTITQLADRTVVSIEGTAMAAGNTAFSVLGKSPGVFIDPEGNIELNGRRGVTVMINGRLTYLSAADLRNMLEGMSAENIKSIELITNPSSKYDAEGTAGMINILLKKNTFRGISGSVNTAYSNNFKQSIYSAGGSINYKNRDVSTFLSADFNHRAGGREATFTRVFNGTNTTTFFDQTATGNFTAEGPPTVRGGADLDFNRRHSAGFVLQAIQNTSHSDFLTETFIGNNAGAPVRFIDADNLSSNRFRSRSGNLHYAFKPDTNGTVLSFDADYAKISNRGTAEFINSYTDIPNNSKTLERLSTRTPNGYTIRAGKVDFVHPMKNNRRLEAGIKASRVISDNDFRFYFNNGTLVPDPLRTNRFYYEEEIYAAYANWSGSLNKNLTYQTGLRAEKTVSNGQLITTGQVTKRRYTNLFPSLFLQQKINADWGINLNYAHRLSRPGYGSLNPFRSYRDPYTYTEGNPYLRPSYTHAITVSPVFKKLYIFQFSFQAAKDVISEIPILDVANTTTIYTSGNVSRLRSGGLTTIAPFKITKKWDTRNSLQLLYSKYMTSANTGALVNEQLFASFQSAHTILLPKDLRLELNFTVRGPAASGLYRMEGVSWLDAGLKKSFLDKKLELTLTANDIYKGNRFRWTTDIAGNVNKFDQYFRFRTVGAALRYNFSKGQKVNLRQTKRIEELDRT